MKWVFIAIVMYFASLFLPLYWVFGQDAQQDPLLLQQMSLSSQVRSALRDSRESMEQSTKYFQSMINSLQTQTNAQSTEILTLRKHWTDTTNSYNIASEALEKSNVLLEVEKARNATLSSMINKVLLWGTILFLINVAGKIVMFILYAKKVKVPRWLDIII